MSAWPADGDAAELAILDVGDDVVQRRSRPYGVSSARSNSKYTTPLSGRAPAAAPPARSPPPGRPPARGSRRCAWCSTASSPLFSMHRVASLGQQGVADAVRPGAEHADLGVLRCARLGADDRSRQGQRRRAGEDLPKHGMIPFLTLSKPPARSLRAPLSSRQPGKASCELTVNHATVSPTFSPELHIVVHWYCIKGKYTVSQDCRAAPDNSG